MRRFAPLVPHRGSISRLFLGLVVALVAAFTTIQAQIPGRNVNVVSGLSLPDGDPYLQRQNEPSIAASTRNPLHLLGGSNDYRTIDLPGLPEDEETRDAWLGLFKSFDGGQRWTSGLLPGYPQDQTVAGLASPLKRYQAGADAVVRAGTNGLIYYSGLVFDRVENGKSGVFLARFVDNNNREGGDPIAYLGTTMVAASSGDKFLDKPWMAVDIPRDTTATCTITSSNANPMAPSPSLSGSSNRGGRRKNAVLPAAAPGTQRVPAGAVYVSYSSITGSGASLRAEIYLTRSMDCGATWSAPMRVSRAEDQINQGASITIDPRTGAVYVGWRRFDPNVLDAIDLDAVMVARLPFGGRKVDPPGRAYGFPRAQSRRVARRLDNIFEHRGKKGNDSKSEEASDQVDQFDLGTSPYNFRTNAYPAMAADGSGRIYLAWTQRGFSAPDGRFGQGARIVISTTRDGRTFTAPSPVDDTGAGHQLMPSMAFAGGKLMLVFYDLRETRADTFNASISDAATRSGLRHTIDIRSAMASPGDYPAFSGSVPVSQYLMGYAQKPGGTLTPGIRPLQVNPPNLPMFKQGTVPFMGDYIDVTAAPVFVPIGNGRWAYNTRSTGELPTFHAVWTDNRDVRPPLGGNWKKYTPVSVTGSNPSTVCEPGNTGSRNQNIYSSRITGGLLAGSPGNTKPLSPGLQRAFVVFAQNTTADLKSYRMTILNQPPGGRASFEQFAAPGAGPDTAVEMLVPPRSTASRTVYVTSTDPKAQITIDVSELEYNGALPIPATAEKTGGLEARVMLNPDIENPDIENPDIENVEVYNPDIENPDIENPDIENPDIENPDIENPDIENPDIENPDIENVRVANPDIENPDIENPDIENPDIENPDIENPDIENGAIADVTWKVSNDGNTTAAFNVNVFLAQQNLPDPTLVKTQLILFKTYRTPAAQKNGCALGFQTRNILVANILNPAFIRPNSAGVPDQNDPSEKNASMWLAPGEEGRITLRVIDTRSDLPPNFTFTDANGNEKTVRIDPAFAPTTSTTPTISSQGVGTEAAAGGDTDPPLVTPTGANLFFLQMPTNAVEQAAIAPAVSVQVRDNLTGTPVPGATVALSLGNLLLDATLAGNVAVANVNGVATFPLLSVSTAGTGYTLVAAATAGGVMATAVSTPFNVTASTVVINTAGSGLGSLRAAMLAANAMPGVQTITFNIPGVTPASPAVIAVQTPLPTISSSMVIDARTQPGYDNRPVVEVTWAGGDPAANGFTIDFDQTNVQILALAITGFPQFGIQSLQADSPGGGAHQIRFNTIGTDRFSAAGKGNQIGIEMRTDDALIETNVISGNAGAGLLVINDADRVKIAGNRIGTDFEGLVALPNDTGIRMYDSLNDIDILSNLIAGNAEYGIDIQNSEAGDVTNTRIRGNRIGVSNDGSTLGNGDGGIRVDNAPGTIIGTPSGGGNIISGNGGAGIAVTGATSIGVVIQSNRIGSDPLGMAPRGNQGPGIQITVSGVEVGWRTGDAADAGNLISGNGSDGIQLRGVGATGNRVRGNWIGTNAAGTAALGSNVPPSPFSNFQGIYVTGPSNVIGGPLPAERNVLSGNRVNGVYLHNAGATGNVVQGNYIGTNLSGTAAVANGFEGVGLIDAPANSVVGNVVSGNARFGFYVTGNANTIDGNLIGTTAGGAGALGNLNSGIYLAATGTVVGGAAPNAIAFNVGSGVVVASGAGNQIASNSIRDNTLLGIDLAGNGVTLNDTNDADTGPNGLQNFPTLSNARNPSGENTWVDFQTGTFAPGNYTLRFFAGTCDANSYGEGARQVGLIGPIANGTSGAIQLTELLAVGQAITATATDGAGNTSEFSACNAVAAAPSGTITAVSPGSPSANQMVTIQGTGLPLFGAEPFTRPKAFFTQGATTSEGFVFFGDSNKWWVRLPGGMAPGAATVYAATSAGVQVSAPFNLAISATPAAPIITAILPLNGPTANGGGAACGGGYASLVPTGTATPGQGIAVVAYGVDTSGATVVFTQGANVFQVAADCAMASVSPGLGVTVTVPAGLTPGPVTVQVKQSVGANTSLLSTPVTMTVPGATITVVGPAGGFGGSPYGPVDCPAGSVVVGFLGRAGQDIDRTSIACASLPGLAPTGTFFVAGGFGGSDYGATLTCGAGEAITGVFGQIKAPGYIDRLGVTCRNLSTFAATNLGPVAGDDGGAGFSLSCPAGQKVVGLQGRQGALMDQISLRCQ